MPYDFNRLVEAAERHTRGRADYLTAVPGLALGRRIAPSAFEPILYEASLCIVAQGAKEVQLAGEVFRYDRAQSLIVSVDLPVAARVVEASPQRPCLAIRVSLDLPKASEFLTGRTAPPRPGAMGRALAPVNGPLLDAVTRLVLLLESPTDAPALAPLILLEISYRLLQGPQRERLVQMATAGGPAQRVAQAVRWLTTHFAEPLQVPALAELVGMSPSALHLHFKTVTGMSPLQYQKRLRLQEARRLMLADGLEAAEAAFRIGYESPSQFGREYRRQFGRPPKQDVDELRSRLRP